MGSVKNLEKTMGVSKVKERFGASFGANLVNFDGYTEVGCETFGESTSGSTMVQDYIQTLYINNNEYNFNGIMVEVDNFIYAIAIYSYMSTSAHLIKFDKFGGRFLGGWPVNMSIQNSSSISLNLDKTNRVMYVISSYGSHPNLTHYMRKFDIDSDSFLDTQKSIGGYDAFRYFEFDFEGGYAYCVPSAASTSHSLNIVNLATMATTSKTITTTTSATMYLKAGWWGYDEEDKPIYKLLFFQSSAASSKYIIYDVTNGEKLIDATIPITHSDVYTNNFGLYDPDSGKVYTFITRDAAEYHLLEYDTLEGTFELYDAMSSPFYTTPQFYGFDYHKKIGNKLYLTLNDGRVVVFNIETKLFEDVVYNSAWYMPIKRSTGSFWIDFDRNLLYCTAGKGYWVINLDIENLNSLETSGETVAIIEPDFMYAPGATTITTYYVWIEVDGIKIRRKLVPDQPLIISAKNGIKVNNSAQIIITWGVK